MLEKYYDYSCCRYVVAKLLWYLQCFRIKPEFDTQKVINLHKYFHSICMTCHCFRKKRWTSFNNIFCIKMLPDGNNNSQKSSYTTAPSVAKWTEKSHNAVRLGGGGGGGGGGPGRASERSVVWLTREMSRLVARFAPNISRTLED